MKKKTIVIFALSLVVIVVVIIAICIVNPQTITGRCLVTTDGTYMIVDKNGSPIVMDNQSDNESLFDGLNSGDKIIVICDMIKTSYPGNTGVTKCQLIKKGSLEDVPEATLSELRDMGYRFE